MPDLAARVLQRLTAGGVQLERGLSDRELSRVQDRLGFTFGPEHRELLQSAMPVGRSWPDWRNDPEDELRGRLDRPIEGVIFDVRNNGFWPASWGHRPDGSEDREREARSRLADVARLVPVFSHRCLPSGAQFAPSPVFSVHQTDVIFYGDNLLDYVAHEFKVPPLHPSARVHVPFWSNLAEGAENGDL
ncbi:hypothetical protein KMZ32_03900 [Phycicoccus sp. MAQZ13P-2]|uniref:hypothetical protein n=1 Tax=Phycicoccus mangrovi TaxID=2840470 RepID=UPI001C005383|nr:hypothetical protein [Phycicoccus mangrovi]MBT9254580.1 hypothetical protein [Phycicoccus mangrovi]MBT9273215.1 hypothetical protein [Phycicoccus mangrovi]